jgi:Spy/CpxP family protein refolding chaperone
MKKVWPAVVIGVMVIGLSGWPASAQHRPMLGEMDRGPGMFMLLFKGAALTPDQETRVKAILAAHRANARDLMRQLRLAREGIVDKLIAPGAVAAGDLEPVRQQITQLEEQLSQDRLAAALEIRALLTPDQLAKAQRLKDRVRELRAEMRALFEGTAQP